MSINDKRTQKHTKHMEGIKMARMETAKYYSKYDIKQIERKAINKYKKERKETFLIALTLIILFSIILACCAYVLMYGY